MDWVIGIQKAINYIEEHLTEEIDYEEVAAQSFSSGFHFQRVFSILCGFTLGEYIRNRRLSQAGAELTGQDVKVIDVYVVFETTHQKYPMEEYRDIRERLVSEWLPGSGYEFSEGPELALVHWRTGEQKDQRFVEIWIPVKKVK